MGARASLIAPGRWRSRPRPHLAQVALASASAAVLLLASAGAASGSPPPSASHPRLGSSSRGHKHQPKHHTHKAQTQGVHPCLEGNWDVTSLTLSTTGLSFTGGVGTTVDIMSNGDAVGNFTPGTPLTGTEGSAKFSGTITDHYGFSPTTKALSGSFQTTSVTNDATITVGGITKAVSASPEQGSFTCSGKNLTLIFTSNGNSLTYQLEPAG